MFRSAAQRFTQKVHQHWKNPEERKSIYCLGSTFVGGVAGVSFVDYEPERSSLNNAKDFIGAGIFGCACGMSIGIIGIVLYPLLVPIGVFGIPVGCTAMLVKKSSTPNYPILSQEESEHSSQEIQQIHQTIFDECPGE